MDVVEELELLEVGLVVERVDELDDPVVVEASNVWKTLPFWPA